MITKDKNGNEVNTEKVFGIEYWFEYVFEDGSRSKQFWRFWNKYKTQEGMNHAWDEKYGKLDGLVDVNFIEEPPKSKKKVQSFVHHYRKTTVCYDL